MEGASIGGVSWHCRDLFVPSDRRRRRSPRCKIAGMDLTTLPTAAEQIERIRAAQPAWERQSVRQRLRPVRALRRLVTDECDALCQTARRELGKSPEETIAGDLLPLADACLFLEREADHLLRPRRVPTAQRPLWLWGQSDRVHRRPRGVVGVIGTWNYPFLLNGVQIVQALTAGNGVLWKPSEVAPGCAEGLHGLFRRAGFPDGLLQRMEATREAGQALTEAAVDHVVFTGSAAVGRRIAARLGERLISCTLELSGCDAMFVLDDADVGDGGAGGVVRGHAQPWPDVHRRSPGLRPSIRISGVLRSAEGDGVGRGPGEAGRWRRRRGWRNGWCARRWPTAAGCWRPSLRPTAIRRPSRRR